MHPDPQQQASAVKSLGELEWALATIRKCQEIVHRNMLLDETLEHTDLYLLTGILWLKEAIHAQVLVVERRFDERPAKKDPKPKSPTPPEEGAEGKAGWEA